MIDSTSVRGGVVAYSAGEANFAFTVYSSGPNSGGAIPQAQSPGTGLQPLPIDLTRLTQGVLIGRIDDGGPRASTVIVDNEYHSWPATEHSLIEKSQ